MPLELGIGMEHVFNEAKYVYNDFLYKSESVHPHTYSIDDSTIAIYEYHKTLGVSMFSNVLCPDAATLLCIRPLCI